MFGIGPKRQMEIIDHGRQTVGEFDYVVVGAGSGGCAVAGRLAEDPDVSVLVLEAGGYGKSLFVDMPGGTGLLFANPKYDWGYHSTPQEHLNNRRIYYPRGKGMGGSSLMNGLVYMRGNRRDYDQWRGLGLEGWGYSDVLPYFRRAASAEHRKSPYHASGGPLKTELSANYRDVDDIFLEAARQADVPINPDFCGETQIGAGVVDVTTYKGQRQTAARAYLADAGSNLFIRTDARVTRLVIEGERVTGVEYETPNGKWTVRAEREVIVSLGAFASPQLLMTSGIGPADHLREHGLPVHVDLPGVGQNLQDHLNVPIQFDCLTRKYSFARYQRLDRAIKLGIEFLLKGTGPGAGPFWSSCVFLGFDDPDYPDTQTYFTPMVMSEKTDASGRYAAEAADGIITRILEDLGSRIISRGRKALHGFQLDVNQMRPDARGVVRLASENPRDYPLINPRFFSEEKERRDLIQGVRRIREIMAQPAFEGICGREFSPGSHRQTDAEIAEGIRETAYSGHHPVGTCKMGADNDPMAVLDSQLRVRGMGNLRVVDGSIFPTQICGNPNAPIMMIGEKAADMIKGRVPLPPEETGEL